MNLTKAKIKLIIKSPFFATLALSMGYKEDDSIPTACTDGTNIIYNPKFIDSLTVDEIVGLLAHEVMHVANLHHLRIQDREHDRFNAAADYAVNEILVASDFKLPNGALLDRKYKNMSTEEIYNLLPKDTQKPKFGDVIKNQSKTESEKQEEVNRVKTMVAKASTVARSQGKLPLGIERFVNDILTPVINWREVLVRFMTEKANLDYQWTMPNKRYLPTYLPSLQAVPVLGEIVLVVDTSGSIDNKLLDEFASEISDICLMISKPLLVIYVDTKVCAVQTFEPDDHIILNPKGGGGTSFVPAFNYLDANEISPACLIYFTDGECNSYPSEPDYPVLWAIYNNNNFKPNFGEIIKIK